MEKARGIPDYCSGSFQVCVTRQFYAERIVWNGMGIGGQWMTGNPFYVYHPTPYRDSWTKRDATEEGRQADWVACGGDADGGSSMHVKRMLPGETNEQARTRQEFALQRCMIQAGYRYTGNCSSADMKARPLCGAP